MPHSTLKLCTHRKLNTSTGAFQHLLVTPGGSEHKHAKSTSKHHVQHHPLCTVFLLHYHTFRAVSHSLHFCVMRSFCFCLPPPLPLEPSIKREDGRFKKKKKINIWSTQLFCTPLNVNEAEALITVATADKHNALSTHSQRREGKMIFFL
ncbi:hypothetical protein ILYODFUR_019686 [Ilyodon furcidens]|uniref:Uncharacterized protein n=1 Tax=Ilyodon furcidens TaxID=33524 RepID=A0ABV0T057_9TELE